MYDVIIIGAGPAGLTALLYAKMQGLIPLCIGDQIGGKLISAPDIIDYPGIETIHGKEYIAHLLNQVKKHEGEIIQAEVVELIKDESRFTVKTSTEAYQSKTIIFATGNGNKQKTNRAQTLAQTFGVNMEKGQFIIDKNNMTTIPGIYAAGDCLIYPQSVEQLANAVASGIKVVAGIYEVLNNKKPPILWGSAKIMRI